MLGCPPLSPKQTRLTLKNLKGRYRWRDRAIVVLGIRSGLRISELLSLKVEDVWTGNSTRERIYLGRKNAKGKGRGDSIVLHPKAATAITKWIQSRGTVSGNDWLFQVSAARDALSVESQLGPYCTTRFCTLELKEWQEVTVYVRRSARMYTVRWAGISFGYHTPCATPPR